MQICISSIFPEGHDIYSCISHAADSIGLKELPCYEVRVGEQYDWIKKTQVGLFVRWLACFSFCLQIFLLIERRVYDFCWSINRPSCNLVAPINFICFKCSHRLWIIGLPTNSRWIWFTFLQESFNPIKVTDGLWIVPEWKTPPVRSSQNMFSKFFCCNGFLLYISDLLIYFNKYMTFNSLLEHCGSFFVHTSGLQF